ncbi:hypothetical protein PAMA_010494 [Pampus argenteus]
MSCISTALLLRHILFPLLFSLRETSPHDESQVEEEAYAQLKWSLISKTKTTLLTADDHVSHRASCESLTKMATTLDGSLNIYTTAV